MTHYCTYFDSRYLYRGLCLYRSLVRHAAPFTLWVLCLDDQAYDALVRLRLEHARLVRLGELEGFDAELAASQRTRSRVEYYFTCSPCWPLYIMAHAPSAETVTYLDADLYFFANPRPVFDEFVDRSVLIVAHRFPASLRHLERFGMFNVGFLSFRRNGEGLECLRWWRARCLEWCYDRCEDGRFADQKYLDEWPARFSGVHVLGHAGSGLAPWNIAGQPVSVRAGVPVVNDATPLIFYHFHGLRMLNRWLFDPGLDAYGARPRGAIRSTIYRPYIREIKRVAAWVTRNAPSFRFSPGTLRGQGYDRPSALRMLARGRAMLSLGSAVF